MLIALTEVDGERVWLNPLYVRLVKEKKGGKKTEVFYHVDPARSGDRFLTVVEPADDVARRVSDALSLIGGSLGLGGIAALTADGPTTSDSDGDDVVADA